jgi:hypothetical protein
VKRPNFFIVGAGRSGTTALWRYLREHPRVFMPRVKEPRFFADDMPGLMNRVAALEDYLALFKDATDEHVAVGEASPQYLYSKTAIRKIRDFAPDARLVVMLRNPVDMAHSAHAECLYWFVEDEPDFERAWRLQARRRRGERVPAACTQVTVLLWEDMCRLGEQVGRLLDVFPREQVKLVLFEDFVADARRAYEDVLAFLRVPSDGRTDFPRVRSTRRHRLAPLGRLLVNPPRGLAPVRRFALAAPVLRGLWESVTRLNTVEYERERLRPGFRSELVEAFREDVERLSRLLGRDLAHWHE